LLCFGIGPAIRCYKRLRIREVTIVKKEKSDIDLENSQSYAISIQQAQ
jgi:hypothetical protein